MNKTFEGLSFADERHGWAVGWGGVIVHTRDGGKRWEAQNNGFTDRFFRIHFVDDRHGWITGEAGTILHSERRRTELDAAGDRNGGVGLVGPFHLAAGGMGGRRQGAPPSHGRWREALGAPAEGDRGRSGRDFFISPKIGWIVGETGMIFRTDNGGKRWDVQIERYDRQSH
ncbi:MAG: YCF48-related protein [Candidatus Manganitrophus sp.]|nr:YCF48-related protein [Candidatus Manganitrophus sp.]